MRVLIAAGGTGGHLYPGIALAGELKRLRPGTEVRFVGTAKGLESRVLPREGYLLDLIRARGLVGTGLRRGAASLALLPVALWDSLRIVGRFQPHLVIGVGGYASGPAVLAAWLRRTPTVILEPNAVPGVTNRLLAPLADLVVTAFEEAAASLRGRTVEVLGNPIRREIVERCRDMGTAGQATPVTDENQRTSGGEGSDTERPWSPGVLPPDRATLHSPGLSLGQHGSPHKKTLLIMGGSQGARAINRAMVGALPELRRQEKFLIIHQTGGADLEWVRGEYSKAGFNDARVEPFLYDIPEIYAAADLVVSRAGATTVAELTAAGLPAILIPFPYATHQHQERNAGSLQAAGAAVVLTDGELSGPLLAGWIEKLLGDPGRLRAMAIRSRAAGRPDAGEKIASACFQVAEARSGSGQRRAILRP